MTTRLMLNKPYGFGFSRNSRDRLSATAAVIFLVLTIGSAWAGDYGRFCSKTALVLLKARRNGVKDDFFVAKANCLNISGEEERKACFAEARETLKEDAKLCRE